MLQAVKKLFDWTPSDIAAWERIRQKGLICFTLWYGLTFSGIMFLIAVAIALFTWAKPVGSLASMIFPLTLIAIVCLLGGLITSLVTWWIEERIYQKIIHSSQ